MTTRLVLATHNDAKVAELREILAGMDVRLLSADDCAAEGLDLPDVEETGDSFAANALLKARAGVMTTGLPCIADDSGLVVDALDGQPGIHSARYASLSGITAEGRVATDRANLDLLLERMADVPGPQRTGRFVCAAALALPDGGYDTIEATMEGTILTGPRGEGGFGYDPVFLPAGHDLTTSEMTAAQKHAISHRGKAFRALRPLIADYLAWTTRGR